MNLPFSFVFHVGDKLGVDEGVLVLISIHFHHEADSAPRHNEQNDWHPEEGLHAHQSCHLLVRGDVASHFSRRVHLGINKLYLGLSYHSY